MINNFSKRGCREKQDRGENSENLQVYSSLKRVYTFLFLLTYSHHRNLGLNSFYLLKTVIMILM